MDDEARVARVERELRVGLGAWSTGSAAVGAVVALAGRRTERPGAQAFGVQTLLWAGVDAAVLGAGALARARAARPVSAARLRRVLLVNAGADVGYVVTGLVLVARSDRRGRHLREHGLAVVVQGLALLVLDGRSAARLRPWGVRG